MKVWPALNDTARVALAVAAVWAILQLADAVRDVALHLDGIARELRGIQYAIAAAPEG